MSARTYRVSLISLCYIKCCQLTSLYPVTCFGIRLTILHVNIRLYPNSSIIRSEPDSSIIRSEPDSSIILSKGSLI